MDTRLSRRRFLGTSAAATAAAGLTVGFNLSGAAAAGAAPEFDAWLRIAPDGAVTLLSRSCEIGQGALSGLAQVLADELDADPADVRVEMAPVTAAYEIKGL
ncbi:MAG TPA: molybdopterin cofactor-binding domain-containing protein, partial [Azospirillaceae bacterium]|nr:molybdopterin cofactor-binding domain-containing protein [Azospirillaceae bacterium]